MAAVPPQKEEMQRRLQLLQGLPGMRYKTTWCFQPCRFLLPFAQIAEGHIAALTPPLGVYCVEWDVPMVLHSHCSRAYRLKVCTAWLPPGGSWIFYQAALRNRLIKKTDEGRRWLKVSDFPPLSGETQNICHSSSCIYLPTCRHPSSASLRSAASPRGKPRALRASGSPSWRPLQAQRFLHKYHPIKPLCCVSCGRPPLLVR